MPSIPIFDFLGNLKINQSLSIPAPPSLSVCVFRSEDNSQELVLTFYLVKSDSLVSLCSLVRASWPHNFNSPVSTSTHPCLTFYVGSKDHAQVARLTWQAIYLASRLSGPQLLTSCELEMGPECRLGVVRGGFLAPMLFWG